MMSSRYMSTSERFISPRTVFMSLWNVAGALMSPKGIQVYSYRPMGVVKAVFQRSSRAFPTCRYPDIRSKLEKYLAFPRASNDSSILGIGYASVSLRKIVHCEEEVCSISHHLT